MVRCPENQFSHVEAHNDSILLLLGFFGLGKRKKNDTDIKNMLCFLAHLSRRLTGELIVYPCSGVRPSSVRRPQFQRSSPLKPLGQSKPNFMWSILRKGERKFI